MNNKMLTLTILYSTLFLTMLSIDPGAGLKRAYAEKCEDITGTEKWDGQGHDDNEKSTKKGERMVFGDKNGEDQETPCNITKAIDHVSIDFKITGKSEYKEFKETFAYMATSDDAQDCFDKRFKLPNDEGKPELKAYEYKNCMLNEY